MLQIYKNLIRNDKTEVGFCYLIAVEKYEEINFTLRLRQIQKKHFWLFRDLFWKREFHNREKKVSIIKLLHGDIKMLKTKINLNYILKKNLVCTEQ